MNEFREMLLKRREEEEIKQFDEIINKPNLTPDELWLLTDKNFKAWRIKHDYPKLLKCINEKFPAFIQWKSEYEITDEMIMECGLSSFIRHKKLSKDKYFYLLEQTFDGNKRLLVSYADLTKSTTLFHDHEESYILQKKFLPYYDWCKKNKILSDLFNISTREAPGYYLEKVILDSGYELLKMGGISPPINGFGILMRGKHLEFVNLCGLKLEGEIHYGELGTPSFAFCAVDNLICDNLNMSLLKFENCSVEDMKITNSHIRQWRFWECTVTGDIINSKIYIMHIFGGLFSPIIKDTNILELEANHKGYWQKNFSYTYSSLKKIYADQGDESKAAEYFIKERELSRELSSGWKYFTKTLSYFYWGYGKKPHRIIYISIATIFICASIYFCFPSLINSTAPNQTIIDSIYFSTVTFTTLGYGDFSPLGGLRIVSLIEAFFGAMSIGFLVAGFSNTKY